MAKRQAIERQARLIAKNLVGRRTWNDREKRYRRTMERRDTQVCVTGERDRENKKRQRIARFTTDSTESNDDGTSVAALAWLWAAVLLFPCFLADPALGPKTRAVRIMVFVTFYVTRSKLPPLLPTTTTFLSSLHTFNVDEHLLARVFATGTCNNYSYALNVGWCIYEFVRKLNYYLSRQFFGLLLFLLWKENMSLIIVIRTFNQIYNIRTLKRCHYQTVCVNYTGISWNWLLHLISYITIARWKSIINVAYYEID